MKTIRISILASLASSLAYIVPAYADAAPAGQGGGFASLIPLILIMVIFYFLLIRPQQKKLKAHAALVNELKKGDRVLTGGGIYGRVTQAKDGDEVLTIEIADGVRVKVKRDTIVALADIKPAKEKGGKREKAEAAADDKNDNK